MATWVFGYGSLLFRPGFAFEAAERGRVRGYARRFYQGSPDHRGTPEQPGRVVTLVADPDEACEGIAYAVDEAAAARTLADLDVREQGGYHRTRVEVELARPSQGRVGAITWIATPENPHWLGDASHGAIAEHARASHGPSGANAAYVLRLDETLTALGIVDAHVRAIADLLRAGGRPARGPRKRPAL